MAFTIFYYSNQVRILSTNLIPVEKYYYYIYTDNQQTQRTLDNSNNGSLLFSGTTQ